MNDLKTKTMYLLTEHKKVFNQNPAKRVLMDHIKLLQDRVDTLEKSAEVTQKSLPDLEVDAKVLVWTDPSKKYRRHFSHFSDGHIYTFDSGATSFSKLHRNSISCWPHWELAE